MLSFVFIFELFFNKNILVCKEVVFFSRFKNIFYINISIKCINDA